MTRAMIIESKTPKTFWPEALATSIYLLNRLPTQILDFQTPLQFLSTTAEILLPLTLQPRIFGSSVFVHIPKHERNKLSPLAIKCVFVGYGVNQKGYRCYDPKTKRMFTTMNCDFLETEYFFGESESNNSDKSNENDPLSWLPMSSPPQAGPTEKVSGTAEPVSEIQLPVMSSTNLISDVSTSDSDSPSDDNFDSTDEDTVETGEPQEQGIPNEVELVDWGSRWGYREICPTSQGKSKSSTKMIQHREDRQKSSILHREQCKRPNVRNGLSFRSSII